MDDFKELLSNYADKMFLRGIAHCRMLDKCTSKSTMGCACFYCTRYLETIDISIDAEYKLHNWVRNNL